MLGVGVKGTVRNGSKYRFVVDFGSYVFTYDLDLLMGNGGLVVDDHRANYVLSELNIIKRAINKSKLC